MTHARVATVVLSWNDAARVIALVDSLAKLTRAPDLVVVVDNGSEGSGLANVRRALAKIEIIELARNLGFAAAVNRGIERALADGAEWIWLLNTDVVLPPDALVTLLASASADQRCGMTAATLVEPDGTIQARGGGRVNLWTGVSRHVLSDREDCHYLTGACLLIRAAMLREIGLFDEAYFFYWEDVDLSFRARAAGWKLAVADGCRVVHLEGSSLGRWSERRWDLMFRGMNRFLSVHAPLPRTAAVLRLLHHSAAMLRHGRLDAARGAWRAMIAAPPSRARRRVRRGTRTAAENPR